MNIINPSDGYSGVIAHTSAWVSPSRTQESLTILVATTSVLGVELSNYNMTITPQKAGNKVVLTWDLFYETNNTDCGFVVARNGEVLGNASDGTIATRTASAMTLCDNFDNNIASTPVKKTITFTDVNTLSTSSEYALYGVTTRGTTVGLFLNRSVGGADETGCSEARIMEYTV